MNLWNRMRMMGKKTVLNRIMEQSVIHGDVRLGALSWFI